MEFPVGADAQAGIFLQGDRVFDGLGLQVPQSLGGQLAARMFGPRIVDRLRPQQASDHVGFEGWGPIFIGHRSFSNFL
jgi:hypothetical protein